MLSHFIEFENFGWNAITVTFFFTTFFGLYGSWGLIKQICRVQRFGLGSVSIIWSLTFAFMFATYLPFGIVAHKGAAFLQFFFRVPFYAYLIPLLYKANGGFSRKQWLLIAALTVALLCSLVDAGKVFVGISWFGALVAADQPWKIWSNRTNKNCTAAVSIELLWAYEASIGFWFIYGLSTQDSAIVAMAIPYILVYTVGIVLYYKYR